MDFRTIANKFIHLNINKGQIYLDEENIEVNKENKEKIYSNFIKYIEDYEDKNFH